MALLSVAIRSVRLQCQLGIELPRSGQDGRKVDDCVDPLVRVRVRGMVWWGYVGR